MIDAADATVEEIQTELCRLMRCFSRRISHGEALQAPATGIGLSAPAIYYTIGRVARSEHGAIPSVSWVEQGGKTDKTSASRDEDEIKISDVVRFRVLVQATTKRNARLLFQNLRNASERVCNNQISWGNSTAPTEEKPNNMTAVFAIEADCDITLSVPQNIQQLDGFPVPLADYVYRTVEAVVDTTLE